MKIRVAICYFVSGLILSITLPNFMNVFRCKHHLFVIIYILAAILKTAAILDLTGIFDCPNNSRVELAINYDGTKFHACITKRSTFVLGLGVQQYIQETLFFSCQYLARSSIFSSTFAKFCKISNP